MCSQDEGAEPHPPQEASQVLSLKWAVRREVVEGEEQAVSMG